MFVVLVFKCQHELECCFILKIDRFSMRFLRFTKKANMAVVIKQEKWLFAFSRICNLILTAALFSLALTKHLTVHNSELVSTGSQPRTEVNIHQTLLFLLSAGVYSWRSSGLCPRLSLLQSSTAPLAVCRLRSPWRSVSTINHAAKHLICWIYKKCLQKVDSRDSI